MNKRLTILVALCAFQASLAVAADTTNDTAAPVAAPAKAFVPVTPKPATPAAPKPAAPAKPAATVTTPAAPDGSSTTPAKPHHPHHPDGKSGGTATNDHHHHGEDGTPVVDANGNTSFFCGSPIIDAQGNMIGTTAVAGCSSNIIVTDGGGSAIISNGYITFAAGRPYQDASGNWQICSGVLTIDTRTARASCEDPFAAPHANALAAEDPAAPPPSPENSLSSDSNASLRSDANMYHR